jgi:SAM-dependent methyltransferase
VELSYDPEIARAFELIRRGQPIDDRWFDSIFPEWAARLSKRHWTPVRVAMRAAELLASGGATHVLDVGSGVGKFCIVASLASLKLRFTGVEQRPRFVEVAQRLVRLYDLPRLTFVTGNMTDLDWSPFDAFYFFNPFQEQLGPACEAIDDTIARDQSLHSLYVRATRSRLRLAPPGTRVVTYHGFGGSGLEGFERRLREPCASGFLELFVKATRNDA